MARLVHGHTPQLHGAWTVEDPFPRSRFLSGDLFLALILPLLVVLALFPLSLHHREGEGKDRKRPQLLWLDQSPHPPHTGKDGLVLPCHRQKYPAGVTQIDCTAGDRKTSVLRDARPRGGFRFDRKDGVFLRALLELEETEDRFGGAGVRSTQELMQDSLQPQASSVDVSIVGWFTEKSLGGQLRETCISFRFQVTKQSVEFTETLGHLPDQTVALYLDLICKG
mmetsp:Transcript_26489/g.52016  ORF Transcript_26489/g.52016 Transcript_26489/m.52016 type:complete len:224 (-) Transcript_26489:39-710(-)